MGDGCKHAFPPDAERQAAGHYDGHSSGLFPLQRGHFGHCREMAVPCQVLRNHLQAPSRWCQLHQHEAYLQDRMEGFRRLLENQQ